MNKEEFKKYVDETLENIYSKLNEEEKTFISDLVTKFNQKCEENEELKRSYARRENKWEKFKTQKDILSSTMSNYLCKYQNLKREYKIQNGHLHKYKQENQSLKEENEYFKKDKESLNKCGFANVIQLLLAYAGLQEENMFLKQENQSSKDVMKRAIEILECSENMFGQRALQILKEINNVNKK